MAIALYTLIFGATLVIFAEAQRSSFSCDANKAILQASPSCGSVIKFGLNNIDVQEILHAFQSNNYGQLTYSGHLASQAQAWVNQCTSGQNPCFQNSGRMYEIFSDQNTLSSAVQLINSSKQSRRNAEITAAKTRKDAEDMTNRLNKMFSSNFPFNNGNNNMFPRNFPFNNGYNNMFPRNFPFNNGYNNMFPRDFPFNNGYNNMFPPNFPFNNSFNSASNLNNGVSLFLRYKRMAGNYVNMVGCGFIACARIGIVHHHLLCYFGSGGNING